MFRTLLLASFIKVSVNKIRSWCGTLISLRWCCILGRFITQSISGNMLLLKTLKYTRLALVVAVIAAGAFLVVANSTNANRAKEQVPQNRKLIDDAECESPDTTVTCYYAYCIESGDECSFWAGACFSIFGGYCDE